MAAAAQDAARTARASSARATAIKQPADALVRIPDSGSGHVLGMTESPDPKPMRVPEQILNDDDLGERPEGSAAPENDPPPTRDDVSDGSTVQSDEDASLNDDD